MADEEKKVVTPEATADEDSATLEAAKESGVSKESLEEEDKFQYKKEDVTNEKAIEKADEKYTGDNIQVLEGLEAVRKRPGMIKELDEIKDKFGDKRLTDISDEAANIDNEDLIPQDEIIVVLTKNGYLKRMSDQTFRAQNRGGRGVKGISTTAGDTVNIMLHTKTHTDLLFFTSLGSVYTLRGYMLTGIQNKPVLAFIGTDIRIFYCRKNLI